jgi:beta-glucosidase-like glycosyl hydrolase
MMLAARLFLESLRFDLEPEDEVRRRAERALKLGAGGFVIFGGEAERIDHWVAEWCSAVRHRLWIASDLERGPGQQFGGLPELPPPLGLAASPDPLEAARAAGRITGRAARAVGVNLVLAPVLDLDIEPRNPIVGTRSFGSRPEEVGRLGRAWIEACQGEGVSACAKHFPGHGRTTADSHDELPVVDAGRTELSEDLEPFRAVADLVAAVMTAHVAYPALGSSRPATLEPHLLEDLLREEMNFEGIVVTDALNMGGFTEALKLPGDPDGTAAGAAAALNAGCDLLLYPADLEHSAALLDRAALADVRTGDRVEASIRRLEETARRVGVSARIADPPASRVQIVDDATVAEKLALDSIRLAGERPWRIRPAIPLRIVTVWDDRPAPSRAPLGAPFAGELRARGWNVLGPEAASPLAKADPTVLLIASTPQAWKGTASLTASGRRAVDEALAAHPGAWPIVFGHPRLLEELDAEGRGMVAWASEEVMERAAAIRLDAELRRAESGGSGASFA